MTSLTSNELLELYPIPVLQQASTFGAISADTIGWLVHEGRKNKLAAGEVLFEPGQRDDSFYIILDGKSGQRLDQRPRTAIADACHRSYGQSIQEERREI